jgi:hypothetical protein
VPMPANVVYVPEVLCGLGDGLAIEANHDAAQLLIAVGDIEVDLIAISVYALTSIEAPHTL